MKTFLQLKEADMLVGGLYKRDEFIKNGKFAYAWDKFTKKNYVPTLIEFNEKLADLRIDFALTDKSTKELLYTEDGKSFRYTIEGMKKLTAAIRELTKEYDALEIEIEPHILVSEDIPQNFTEMEKEVLTGLII